MSMHEHREALRGIPGAERLKMNYEDGGKIEAFSIDDMVVRLRPMATSSEIKEAFLRAIGG